jgi:hypothetical protein
MLRKITTGALAALSLTALSSAPALAQGGPWGIRVFAGVYTAKDWSGGGDVTRRIQDACRRSDNCMVPCSNDSFGDAAPGQEKECRVAYRCPDGSMRTSVAHENDPLVLDCRGGGDGGRGYPYP